MSGINQTDFVSKVPEVTAGFWIIKIAATTLGETGGDAVTMTLHAGYALGTILFAALFVVLVATQMRATRFRPFLYWSVIVATTTVGTTLADFADRSMGIGYTGGTALLASLLAVSLAIWHYATGTISADSIRTPRAEAFYWCAILFSQTLGTACGDLLSVSAGLGYLGGTAVFLAALAVVLLLYFATKLSRVLLFWSAFVLTRPFGATMGDFLDKPTAHGGLAIGRIEASAILLVAIVALVALIPQRPAQAPHGA